VPNGLGTQDDTQDHSKGGMKHLLKAAIRTVGKYGFDGSDALTHVVN
jgi:hypothetical protein